MTVTHPKHTILHVGLYRISSSLLCSYLAYNRHSALAYWVSLKQVLPRILSAIVEYLVLLELGLVMRVLSILVHVEPVLACTC